MAQKACMALAQTTDELKKYYIYLCTSSWHVLIYEFELESLTEERIIAVNTSANKIWMTGHSLDTSIQNLVHQYSHDSNQFDAQAIETDLQELAQLTFMPDLRYQTMVHLLGQIIISRVVEQGGGASNDKLVQIIWRILQHQKLLKFPVPDRKAILIRTLDMISQKIRNRVPAQSGTSHVSA